MRGSSLRRALGADREAREPLPLCRPVLLESGMKFVVFVPNIRLRSSEHLLRWLRRLIVKREREFSVGVTGGVPGLSGNPRISLGVAVLNTVG